MAKPRKQDEPKVRRDRSCGVVPVAVDPADGTRRYLLIQHHAGHWGFPKGHPDKGESDLDAARRELREETGLTAVELLDEPRLEESYRFTGKREVIDKSVVYFIGLVADMDITPQEEEINDFAWGTHAETRALMTFKEGKRILDEAEAFLSGRSRV